MSPAEKAVLDEKQAALEERLDRMLDDTNVNIAVRQLENCRLSLEASVSGEFTRQVCHEDLQNERA